jgi:hypothetical protein
MNDDIHDHINKSLSDFRDTIKTVSYDNLERIIASYSLLLEQLDEFNGNFLKTLIEIAEQERDGRLEFKNDQE